MDFRNILIFRTGHLGDTLVSLPVYKAVRNSFPESRLTLLSNANAQKSEYVLARSILPRKGLFDEWMTYPLNLPKLQTAQAFAILFREIRQNNFDAVLYLMTRNRLPAQVRRDALFFKLAGIPKIIGAKYLLKNYLDPASRTPLPVVESETEYLFNCLRFENLPLVKSEIDADLSLTNEETRAAEEWLKANCLLSADEKKMVAVAPGSKWESKIWDEDKFGATIEKLIEKKNVFPIVFGGAEDREKGVRLIARWKRGANAAGELNIRTAAAALAKCRLFVGNDTGTMHLAACAGVPCVAVFAAIDWEGRWKPFGVNNQIIRKKVKCEGCLSPVSLNGNLCLDLITVDEVYAACLKVLNQQDGKPEVS